MKNRMEPSVMQLGTPWVNATPMLRRGPALKAGSRGEIGRDVGFAKSGFRPTVAQFDAVFRTVGTTGSGGPTRSI
jgi:hypothetical protein